MRLVALAYALAALVFVALADTGHLAILLWKIETFVPHGDWLVHFLVVGLFAFVLSFALEGRRVRVLAVEPSLGAVLTCLLATGEELLQGLSPYRTLTLHDLVMNVLGAVVLGTLGTRLAERRRTSPATPNVELASDPP
ncbi:MAG: VanZ family protein [Polyangiales bacterium]